MIITLSRAELASLALRLRTTVWACGLALWAFHGGAVSAEPPGPPVKFSRERGFQEKPFKLQLSHDDDGARIRFTLDGTAPSENHGMVYEDALSIGSNVVVRAAAFKGGAKIGRDTARTFLFPAQIFEQSQDGLPPANWPFEWGRNRVDFGMDPRVTKDPKYAGELVKALTSIPSISLVMDLADLFDERRGIYANAMKRGREVERPCSVEMIRADGEKGFQINAGIRIRGGFSRMDNNAKHSFRLFFRKEYGESRLKYALFGKEGARTFEGFDLRTSQNYSWSMGGDPRAVFIRDIVNRDLQRAAGQLSPRGAFVHLFINGEYWGLYNTCERPEAAFGATYLGGKKAEYDTLKPRGGAGEGGFGGGQGEMPFATDGNRDAWRQLWDAAKAGLAGDEAYFKLLGRNADGERNFRLPVLLDPENLIDYMMVIYYGGNIDSPISKFSGNNMPNNWFAIRSRKGEHGFKFFIWDAEHTFLDVNEDRTGPFSCGDRFEQSNPQWLFQQCLENAEFRQLVADRMQRHFFRGGALSAEKVEEALMKRVKEIESAVILESARWGDSGGGFGSRGGGQGDGPARPRTRDNEWRSEITRIQKEFIATRSGIVVEQLWGLGLWPDLAAPALEVRGDRVELMAPRGEVIYTLNGEDPRSIGGKRREASKVASKETPIPAASSLKARTWSDGEWSPLVEWSPVLAKP